MIKVTKYVIVIVYGGGATMKNEIVKYGNYLNALEFKGFTAADFDFLMYLCAAMKDQDETLITFSLNEIKKATGYDMHVSTLEFAEILKKMNKKLVQITAEVKDGSKTIMFVLFPTFTIDEKTNTLQVRVNPDFKYLLNELTKNFTLFELQEFVELNSKYSKTLYRLLKQFKTTGEYFVNLEELRKLLGCPESYQNKYFMERVIVPAVQELQQDFPLLKCEPIRANKRGRPITGYHFTFRPEGTDQIPGQLTLDQGLEAVREYEEKKKAAVKQGQKGNRFNNFEQREYSKEDYANLERANIIKFSKKDKDNE